jgi:hypothetical protein
MPYRRLLFNLIALCRRGDGSCRRVDRDQPVAACCPKADKKGRRQIREKTLHDPNHAIAISLAGFTQRNMEMARCVRRGFQESGVAGVAECGSNYEVFVAVTGQVGVSGRSHMTPGVPAGENRIKLAKSASNVTRIRSVSIANLRTSESVLPAMPAARTSKASTPNTSAAHRAVRVLKFSSNKRRT